jgi:mannitol/fructose-specific phosphotransferase system IIA component (Ntr-type)
MNVDSFVDALKTAKSKDEIWDIISRQENA